jgi:uncharacterized protein (DUF983 family)
MSDDKPKTDLSQFGGFTCLLTILFIGLKLGGVIAWAWWWVLAPLWLPTAVIAVLILLALIGGFLYGLVRKRDV